MLKQPSKKYRPFPPVHLPDRRWPNRTLAHAPIWCSVDLRDGNQALAIPMNISQKLELFHTLVKCGFKEIEVGFPSANNTEFTCNRRLIEELSVPGGGHGAGSSSSCHMAAQRSKVRRLPRGGSYEVHGDVESPP